MFVPLFTSIELHFTAGNSIWLSLCTFFSTSFPFFLLTTSRRVYSTKSQNRKSHTANNCGKYNIKAQKWKAKYNELTVLLLSVPATLLYWLLLLIFFPIISKAFLWRDKIQSGGEKLSFRNYIARQLFDKEYCAIFDYSVTYILFPSQSWPLRFRCLMMS